MPGQTENHWTIALLIPEGAEALCMLTNPFICAIEANGLFPSKTSVIPQHWVNRIGVAFSFGFETTVGVTMGFVLLQCLWQSVVRQPLTMKRMNSYCIFNFQFVAKKNPK